jgi:phosphoribosylformylglycinamidine cyclo-ligase
MDKSDASKYAGAGVDLKKAGEIKKKIGELALSTFNDKVLRGIGTFGALYDAGTLVDEDLVIVSSCDGVGTKLKIAFIAGKHDTVGMDLVNHCVNDILVMGATPLFFMDYMAIGKMDVDVVENVILGLRNSCRQNNLPLIGGETAEMPGFYKPGEYDLVGFIVGSVRKKNLIDGSRIAEGDKILGLPSNGLHTNGYSLVRSLLVEDKPEVIFKSLPGMDIPLYEELLKVHKSYLGGVTHLLEMSELHGMAHITGGGIVDNIPRVLPGHVNARIDSRTWEVPAIFSHLQKKGGISRDEMFRVFNMGIGFILFVSSAAEDNMVGILEQNGEKAIRLGEVVQGNGQVELI